MSRHDRGMSGANNVPLGSRGPGKGATFGKSDMDRADEGGGSLLKPAYLQGSDALSKHSPPSKNNSRFGGFGGQPPGTDVGEYGSQVEELNETSL